MFDTLQDCDSHQRKVKSEARTQLCKYGLAVARTLWRPSRPPKRAPGDYHRRPATRTTHGEA
jgi:hypothetical protein